MARHQKSEYDPEMHSIVSGKPATTPQEQENRLIALATMRAQQQILDGTASSQVLTHYLKLGTSRERLEQMKLEHEAELLKVKAESFESEKEAAARHEEVLKSFKRYSGNFNDE